jgi:hypothetical protein
MQAATSSSGRTLTGKHGGAYGPDHKITPSRLADEASFWSSALKVFAIAALLAQLTHQSVIAAFSS